MKKSKKSKKGHPTLLEELRKSGVLCELTDRSSEVTCHRAIPVTGRMGGPSRILVPENRDMPVKPCRASAYSPDVPADKLPGHDKEIVAMASTKVGPADKLRVLEGALAGLTPEEKVAEHPALMDEATRQTQIGGSHYTAFPIQPWDIVLTYGLNFWEGNVIKYMLRTKSGKRLEDLQKARHYIDELIRQEALCAS